MTHKTKRRMIITFSILLLIILAIIGVLQHPAFGALPTGERLARIQQSPHWRNGAFRNLEPTPTMTSDESTLTQLWNFLFHRPKNTRPKHAVDAVRTDLRTLDRTTDQVVWFGHSSYMLVVGGLTYVVDPVLTSEFPASLMMKPFKGADVYTPADLPERIDVLIITHDHWDHLDYGTLRRLHGRIGQIVCPLGVGAHLERWGFGDITTELDWHAHTALTTGGRITCLPARHFSGRLLKRAQSLWASFMLEAGGRTIFIGGDSGRGKHFEQIAAQFPLIDLAMMEDGQYDKAWAHIHTLPDELPGIIRTLHPRLVVPIHNGKFALANHTWDEPRALIRAAAEADTTLHVVLPTIGRPIPLPTE